MAKCAHNGNCSKPVYKNGFCKGHYSTVFITGFKKKSKNPLWKGGVAFYPNHSLMKKQRKIILSQHPLCAICGKPAQVIHHLDKSKSNHNINNLIPVCHKCHFGKFHKQAHKSKFSKVYGYSLAELARRQHTRYSHIYQKHIRGELSSLID
jgi:hypothetical protein